MAPDSSKTHTHARDMWATGVTFGYLLQQCESKLPRTCGHTTEDLTLEEAQDYCKRVRYVVAFFAFYQ